MKKKIISLLLTLVVLLGLNTNVGFAYSELITWNEDGTNVGDWIGIDNDTYKPLDVLDDTVDGENVLRFILDEADDNRGARLTVHDNSNEKILNINYDLYIPSSDALYNSDLSAKIFNFTLDDGTEFYVTYDKSLKLINIVSILEGEKNTAELNGIGEVVDVWHNISFEVDFINYSLRYVYLNKESGNLQHGSLPMGTTASKLEAVEVLLPRRTVTDAEEECIVKDFNIERVKTANDFKIFQNAVAELPEEIPLLGEFKPHDKAKNIYVASTGDDANEGTKENPLATLEKALEIVAGLTDEENKFGVSIYLREGEYLIDNTLEITSSQSDLLNNNPLYISAYENENVTLFTGSKISGNEVVKVTEANTSRETINRFDADAVGNVYYIDYSKLGIDKLEGFSDGVVGSAKIPSFYQNSDKMILSRYPDFEDTYVESVTVPGKWNADKVTWVPVDKRVFEWKNTESIAIEGQLCVSWYVNRSVVDIDKDAGTISGYGLITNNTPIGVKLSNDGTPSHYYYMNILEEMNCAGEWCGDDEEKRLYIYPIDGEVKDDDVFSIKNNSIPVMLSILNTNNVVINNLNFKYGNSAIRAESCSQVVVQNCNISHIDGGAISIQDCKKSGVINSDFVDCASGIEIRNSNLGELIPHRNFVQNCIFNRIMGQYCIFNKGHGNIMSHNLLENFQGNGIYMLDAGCENIIEYNEMRAGVLQGSEGACIYINGTMAATNNHIRYNYIHHNQPEGADVNSVGYNISIDDMGEGGYIYGNILEHLKTGLGPHSGDRNIMYKNIFIDTVTAAENSNNYYYFKDRFISAILEGAANERGALCRSYFELGCDESETWNVRYPKLVDRIEWFKDISARYNNLEFDIDSSESNFIRSDTGCYYVGNISVGNTKISYPAVSGRKYLIDDIDVENIQEPDIPRIFQSDYNVIYGNKVLSKNDFTVESIEYFDKIGIVRNVTEESNNKIKISKIISDDKLGVRWLDNMNCNYYVVQISDKDTFDNVIEEYVTTDSYLYIDNPNAGNYLKIKGYLLERDNKNVVCEEIRMYR